MPCKLPDFSQPTRLGKNYVKKHAIKMLFLGMKRVYCLKQDHPEKERKVEEMIWL